MRRAVAVDGPAAGILLECPDGAARMMWSVPHITVQEPRLEPGEALPLTWTDTVYYLATVKFLGRTVHVATVEPGIPPAQDLWLALASDAAILASEEPA